MSTGRRFLIVTGSMRSGTSLLGHTLQQRPGGARAHPDIAFDNDESRVVVDLFAALRRALGGEIGYGDPFLKVTVDEALLDGLGVPPGSAEERRTALREQLTAEIERLAPPGAPPRVHGLKRTSMNYEIGLIDYLFDDVRLVFTVRDPRDILLSHARRLGCEPATPNGLMILAYVLANQAMIRRLAAEGRPPLVLPYETVVSDPVAAVRAILDRTGISPDSYDFDGLLGAAVPNNSSFGPGAGKGFVSGEGITAQSVGRFRQLLDPGLCRFVDYLCGDVLHEGRYEPCEDGVGWRDEFAPLLAALAKRCRAAHISLAAVEARLRDLAAPVTLGG